MSRYVPPQHGAWAFLALPLVLGTLVSPWTPLLLVLAVAWIAAYPWSYAALGLVRAKRNQRFRAPFAAWAAIVLPACAVLLVARPWLVWAGAAYALAFAVNVRYARRNDERAVANDLVFVGECAAMVLVTWAVAVGGGTFAPPPLSSVPSHVWVLVVVCVLVLLGSALHVKSLIRERRNARFAALSRGYAVACAGASLGLAAWWGLPSGWWFVLPFVALAVRAFVVGRKPVRPGAVGMVELGCFILVAAAAALAVHT